MAHLDKVILFGDSITEGSCNQSLGYALTPALQQEYFRRLDFVVRGFGGYNSNHAQYLIDPILDEESTGNGHIRLVVVFFGTNDCALNDHQHVSLEDYVANMNNVVYKIAVRGIKCIVVGAATYDEWVDPHGPRKAEHFLHYNQAASKVAADNGVEFVDLFHSFAKYCGWQEGSQILPGKAVEGSTRVSKMHSDGIHFSGDGYRVWYDELIRVINNHHPELRSDKLKLLYPRLEDIDDNDIPGSLKP